MEGGMEAVIQWITPVGIFIVFGLVGGDLKDPIVHLVVAILMGLAAYMSVWLRRRNMAQFEEIALACLVGASAISFVRVYQTAC